MKRPFIIAEIAQGYEGNAKLVDLYVKAAVNAGADAVKFQIFFADELALPDYKYYGLFKKLELDVKVWEKAINDAHAGNLEFYSDIFGIKSFRMLDKIGTDGFKIHSTDINNFNLIKTIAKSRKKIFLSTGGCEIEEIRQALSLLEGCKVALMYGFQSEPTDCADNNLNRIPLLLEVFGKPVGFQDHSAGASNLAYVLPFIAVGKGSSIIEKHFTLSRGAQIEDYISALTPEEFLRWAKDIREASAALGKDEWHLTAKELAYRVKVRRAVCSSGSIAAGKVISEKNIILKRTDDTGAIFDKDQVIGKKAKYAIKNNFAITEDYII